MSNMFIVMVASVLSQAPVVELPENAVCETCRIVVTAVGEVGGAQPLTFDSKFNQVTAVAVDRTGRLLIGPLRSGFAVVEPRGRGTRFIEIEGPSREGGVAHIRETVGDTLLIVDTDNWLVTVMSPQYKYVRSLRMPGFSEDFLPLPDGGMLSNIVSLGAEYAGVPLFYTSSSGILRAAFGVGASVFMRSHTNLVRRRLGAAQAGFFWAAHRDRYEIDLWSPQLEHVRTISRRVDWFPNGQADQVLAADEGQPGPRMESVEQDAAGRLWVVISAAVEGWEATFRRGADQPSERPMPPHSALNDFFETTIEVIDPAAGALLASTKAKGHLLPVRGSARYLYSWRALRNGSQVIDLWEVSLVNGGGG